MARQVVGACSLKEFYSGPSPCLGSLKFLELSIDEELPAVVSSRPPGVGSCWPILLTCSTSLPARALRVFVSRSEEVCKAAFERTSEVAFEVVSRAVCETVVETVLEAVFEARFEASSDVADRRRLAISSARSSQPSSVSMGMVLDCELVRATKSKVAVAYVFCYSRSRLRSGQALRRRRRVKYSVQKLLWLGGNVNHTHFFRKLRENYD